MMDFETFYNYWSQSLLKQKIGQRGEEKTAYLIAKKPNEAKMEMVAIVVDYSPLIAIQEYIEQERPEFFIFFAEGWQTKDVEIDPLNPRKNLPPSGKIADLPREQRTEAFNIIARDMTRPNHQRSAVYEIIRNKHDIIIKLEPFSANFANDEGLKNAKMKSRLDNIGGAELS